MSPCYIFDNRIIASQIIDSILDYSELEASGPFSRFLEDDPCLICRIALRLEKSGFDVEGLIVDALELLLPSASNSGLDLSFDIARDVPAWVEADYARIRQGEYISTTKELNC